MPYRIGSSAIVLDIESLQKNDFRTAICVNSATPPYRTGFRHKGIVFKNKALFIKLIQNRVCLCLRGIDINKLKKEGNFGFRGK